MLATDLGRTEPAATAHSGTALRLLGAAGAALFVGLLSLPLLSVFLRLSPRQLLAQLAAPVVLQALWLSLRTTFVATAAVALLGLPVAYLLALRRFRGKRLLGVLVDLPMVLPPTVAGLGLLLTFGRLGLVGRLLAPFGVSIPFSELAVVLAQMFVAGPFFVNAARSGFESIDPRYLQAAATLRATPAYTFIRVVLPLSGPALLSGMAMTWARALGEFGATITFAGNLPGHTQTMPLAVYIAMQSDLDAALALSVILVIVAFTLLFTLRALPAPRGH